MSKLTFKNINKVVEKIDVDTNRIRTYEYEVHYDNGTVISVSSKDEVLYADMISDINEFMVKAVRTTEYNCYWNQKYVYTLNEEPEEEPEEKEEGTDVMTKYYDENAAINIYVANLAAYNDGYLMGAWLALPATEEEINEVFEGIKGNYPELEYAIHDYETSLGLEIDEYESIDNLNELAQDLEDLEDYELEAVKAYIEVNGGDIRNAIESINRCTFYENMTLEDLAYELVEEGCYGEINESIKSYIDYSAIARDLGFDNYHEVSNGIIYIG